MPKRDKKNFLTAMAVLVLALAALALFLSRGTDEPGGGPDQSSLSSAAQGLESRGPASPDPEDLPPWRKAPRPTEDPVLTLGFIDALAEFLASSYHPAEGAAKSASSASFRGLNQRFGRSLEGLAHQSQEQGPARKEILDYVLASGMAEKLYALYADWLLEAVLLRCLDNPGLLTLASGRSENRVLTRDETADLFRLNAPRLEALAATLRAVSGHPELAKDLERYLAAARKVEEANARFQEVISQDKPSAKETARSGDRLKTAIAAREQVRADILDRVHGACAGRCQEEDDLLYSLHWCARRLHAAPDRAESLAIMARLLEDLAGRFRSKAAELEAAAPPAAT